MAKDERLYARFDIGMDEHPKIMLLTYSAFRALIECTMYARRQLTDGFLDERVARRKWGDATIAELTTNHPERPSLVRVEGGWRIRDYESHQITRADIEVKRESGRAGGLAKAKRMASKDVAPATNLLQQTASTCLAKTETETENKRTKASVQPSVELIRDFEIFWEVYPRKQGKADALKAYTVVRKKVDAKTVFAGAQAYALLNIGEDKSFLKMPAGWLRGLRWEDEQIVNATRQTVTSNDRFCEIHPDYPVSARFPCEACSSDLGGRDF